MKIILAHKNNPEKAFSINERTYEAVYKKYTLKPDGDADEANAKYVLKKNTPPQTAKTKTI